MGYQLSPLVVSLLVSLGLGIPLMQLAKRLRLMDIPGSASHKTHAHPTPLAGGLLMIAVLAVTALLFRSWLNREMLAALGGALIVFLFGIWDDRKGLSAGPKLIGQLLACGVLILLGVQVRFLEIFSQAGYVSASFAQALNVLITLFWVIGITNAMNMVDSMNGIAAGIGIIASACFLGAAHVSRQETLSFWAASLLGVSAGLYFWNGVTAKFFLGDSASQTLGFLLASFGILYNPLERSPESSWIVPILLLGVPIFDTTLVVLSRLRRGQRIGSGRRDHTYHRLIALGLSPRLAVLTVHLSASILSLLAFFTLYLPPGIALTIFASAILCGLALLLWLERGRTLDEASSENRRA